MLTAILLILATLSADVAWRRRESKRTAVIGAASAALLVLSAGFALPNLLYLQKVVALLLMPIGLVWLLTFTFAAFARARGNNVHAAAMLVVFVSLGVTANPWLGRSLLASLERDYVAVDPFESEPFDVVFVLGGGTSVDGHGNPILGPSGDRVMLGARLWHAGIAKHLVPSGSSIAGIGAARDVAAETELIWQQIDVPETHVSPLAKPRNTSEEVVAYTRLADDRGWERMGMVTSAWHMRRAMKLAEREGLDVEALPADFRGSTGFDGFISLIPTGFGARDMHRACWEYLGAFVGR